MTEVDESLGHFGFRVTVWHDQRAIITHAGVTCVDHRKKAPPVPTTIHTVLQPLQKLLSIWQQAYFHCTVELAKECGAVTVFLGSNDATSIPESSSYKMHVPLEEYRENLKEIISQMKVSLFSVCHDSLCCASKR